jgi:hypothetical protein
MEFRERFPERTIGSPSARRYLKGFARMNAVPTNLRGKSVAALQAEVAALQRGLAESHRARDAARASRPRLIVEGDEVALAENDRASKLAERNVAEFSVTLTGTRAALRRAQERDR